MLTYANFYHGKNLRKLDFNFVDVTFSPPLTMFLFFNNVKNKFQIK